jgi:penicillin-binding protein 2
VDERARSFRMRALLIAASLSFAVLGATLFSMQVVEHQHFADLARDNRQYKRRVLAPRGLILDRNGVILAHNVYQARITYPRRLAQAGDRTLEDLVELLQLDRELVLDRIANAPPGDRITVVRRATPEQIAVVEEHRVVLPQVQLTVEPRRHYRFDSLAGHVMGYVGEVRRDESGPNTPYLPGDMIGRRGIEAYSEEQLRGRHGRKVVEINAAGHIVGEVPEGERSVLPGVNIYLTLHYTLQAKLEELLDGRAGAGVMIEVDSGEILAAASAPAIDPNEYTGGMGFERHEEIRDHPLKPEFNRVFQGVYPPGSPFKLVTAAAALERGRVRETETMEVSCYGSYQFGNRAFGCWKPEGHGRLDLLGAIVQSCDTYFYQLIQRLDVDELAETALRFGYGSSTEVVGIRDHPGLVPTKAYYDERYGPRRWSQGLKLNIAIGQGEYLATPLQLARSYAAIAGDGHLYRPELILARENSYGVREHRRVHRVAEPVASPRVLAFLRRSLRAVVHDEHGTGWRAQVAGYEIAGKTGTSENPFGKDHAWFVAYAPADAPQVSVAVIVENSGHGGSVAAPIVGELLRTYFLLRDGDASARAGTSTEEEVGR